MTRWQEVRWLLKYGIAQGTSERGGITPKRADFAGQSLLELEEGRFSLWPYTDDARYRWQIEIGTLWDGVSCTSGDFTRKHSGVAEQSIALAKQIAAEDLRWECVNTSRAEVLIYSDDCRETEKMRA